MNYAKGLSFSPAEQLKLEKEYKNWIPIDGWKTWKNFLSDISTRLDRNGVNPASQVRFSYDSTGRNVTYGEDLGIDASDTKIEMIEKTASFSVSREDQDVLLEEGVFERISEEPVLEPVQIYCGSQNVDSDGVISESESLLDFQGRCRGYTGKIEKGMENSLLVEKDFSDLGAHSRVTCVEKLMVVEGQKWNRYTVGGLNVCDNAWVYGHLSDYRRYKLIGVVLDYVPLGSSVDLTQLKIMSTFGGHVSITQSGCGKGFIHPLNCVNAVVGSTDGIGEKFKPLLGNGEIEISADATLYSGSEVGAVYVLTEVVFYEKQLKYYDVHDIMILTKKIGFSLNREFLDLKILVEGKIQGQCVRYEWRHGDTIVVKGSQADSLVAIVGSGQKEYVANHCGSLIADVYQTTYRLMSLIASDTGALDTVSVHDGTRLEALEQELVLQSHYGNGLKYRQQWDQLMIGPRVSTIVMNTRASLVSVGQQMELDARRRNWHDVKLNRMRVHVVVPGVRLDFVPDPGGRRKEIL